MPVVFLYYTFFCKLSIFNLSFIDNQLNSDIIGVNTYVFTSVHTILLKWRSVMVNSKTAILVVDMLNDFVTGALKCDRGLAIVPKTAQLLNSARKNDVAVIFCNDAHIKDIDHEFKVWGEHAVAGTYGAEVIPELELCEKDYVVPKRRYSGFFHTDLDLLLRELGIDTVIMTGLHTHMCVRHTTADAFCLGYNILVASDATDSFTEEDYNNGIDYLKTVYGAQVYTVDELVKMFEE